MAFFCENASVQHFTIAAPNFTVPPATFGIWLKAASIVPLNSSLFQWRGSINTGLLLRYFAPDWQLRYYVSNGSQYLTDTGHRLSTGVWQHACLAVTSSQARVYLDGVVFTNNVGHASDDLDETGYLGRDPFPGNASFDGDLAEAAIWNVALSDAECLALAKRVSPLALTNRLPNLVMYRDLVRDAARGTGPALTPINDPSVSPHPRVLAPQGQRMQLFRPAHFSSPYHPAARTVDAGRVLVAAAESPGAGAGVTLPYGEVTS